MTIAVLVLFGCLWFAVSAQRAAGVIERQTESLLGSAATSVDGILSPSAIPVRFGSELERAGLSGKRVALVALRIYRPDDTIALRLHSAMREYEDAYWIGDGQIALALWNVDRQQALAAVARLGRSLLAERLQIMDSGIALFPDDGERFETLWSCALQRLRPVEDYIEHAELQLLCPASVAPAESELLKSA